EPAEDGAVVAVAEIGFDTRGAIELRQRRFSDPARAIAAAREPNRVQGGIVGVLHERLEPCFIVASEMTGAFEALRVKNNLRRAIEKTVCRERLKPRGQLRLDARAGRDNANAERGGHAVFTSFRKSAFLVITGANESGQILFLQRRRRLRDAAVGAHPARQGRDGRGQRSLARSRTPGGEIRVPESPG